MQKCLRIIFIKLKTQTLHSSPILKRDDNHEVVLDDDDGMTNWLGK